jgi:CHAD domain-containing protein
MAQATHEPRYRLGSDETVDAGLRRIVSEQIGLAQQRLGGAGPRDLGEAVHESRKAFKRVRAVARLARDELGDAVYRRENRTFRDAGRKLSAVRDATVLVETLDGLAGESDDTARPFHGLRAKLVAEQEHAHERLRASPAVGEVLKVLEAASARVAAWPLPEDAGHDVLAPGFERIYRRGRKALRAAEKDPATENLHELRKRAKDLWHAAQVARPVSPKKLRKLARRAHWLADLVGEDHDLAVLLAVARQRTGVLEPGELDLLEAAVAARRPRLQREALECAGQVYAHKPAKAAGVVAQ